ncbi:3'(2'),5'-bisphosphate nucleotidase CysQ [Nisaea sediminum]|uniref:3'(2'),5'-bisphosphate nucleotidase CysQ n=1 Tax=Nisaea sediminum TaxID=2775867 RepID=UPI00186706AC|nr:3'(2'),5'-bisphosphate nucleotidase CysQ [Nisaea sediminum]
MDKQSLLNEIILIAREASTLILKYYEGEIAVDDKADGSPVTAADRAADKLIVAGLKKLTPEIPIISEEGFAAGANPDISGGTYWLVDPLDGTKEFIKRNGDFTVNIALLEDFEPVLGVVLTPVTGLASAGVVGDGAFDEEADGSRRTISARQADPKQITVVASRSHRSPELEAYLAELKPAEEISRGSALKFCLVARGEADLYPRVGPTSEWDTAAGQAVLMAAGGSMTSFDGTPFRYGKADERFLNGMFIAKGPGV